jgi:hypothetical protein
MHWLVEGAGPPVAASIPIDWRHGLHPLCPFSGRPTTPSPSSLSEKPQHERKEMRSAAWEKYLTKPVETVEEKNVSSTQSNPPL